MLAILWATGRLAGPAPGAPSPDAVQAGHETVPPPADPPSDRAVFISAARQQLIGVRTAEIARQPLAAAIRTAGVLAYDETQTAEIHSKVAGWIESVDVDFVGKPVRRGQTLFTVYSPDLVQAQSEYLLALKSQAQLGSSVIPETRQGAASLLAAARQRLRLWDVTDAQVADLERTGQPRRTLAVYSPVDGIVLQRNAYPGQFITPEARTFRIAGLSTIWVLGQIFEYELPFVDLGQPAEIEFPYGAANRTLKGRITFVYPEIDPVTRRVKVRIELRNPRFQLKPESYVTVIIRTGGGERLAIPREAVIDNGEARYAILALPDGYFEPRRIETGEPMGDFYPVLSGVQAGDKVVTSAQFLIDSETNLLAAMQAMAGIPEAKPASSSASSAPADRKPAAPPAVSIAFASQPSPPRPGENAFEVKVTDISGQPVTDAGVSVTFSMPAMPSMSMPAMKSAATLTHAGDGVYRGNGQVVMAGRWDVTVSVTRAGQRLGTRRLVVIVK
jgi:RND family efflux transporter MFP subunit